MIAKSSADRQTSIIAQRPPQFYALPVARSSAGSILAPGKKEDMMKYFPILMLAGTLTVASPAVANHVGYLDAPFPTRGACQAQVSALSNDDDWLLDAFPDLFSSEGEVRSFLNKAFPCELNASDGNFYITDHRVEVLDSAWFQQRNH